jgi:phage/plasmid-like protein (TIGR03299 family)
MAAGITAVDGMFYVGETPWHRLGVKLDREATAEEAIEAAGLNWDVIKEPITVRGKVSEHWRAVVRDDTSEILTVRTDTFEPLQNRDAFKFFDGVVGAGEAIYHTAGSLRGGRRVWILAKLPDELDLGGDKLAPYVLLANGHDGKLQVTMKPTTVRVVCENTCDAALQMNGQKQVKFRHVGNVLNKVNDAREGLGLVKAYNALLFAQIERLAETRLTDAESGDYFRKVLGWNPDKKPTEQPIVARRVSQAAQLYTDGAGAKLATADGTAWGAYNAVTALLDHCYNDRAQKQLDAALDRRLQSMWFGQDANTRQVAYDEAYALVPAIVSMGGRNN